MPRRVKELKETEPHRGVSEGKIRDEKDRVGVGERRGDDRDVYIHIYPTDQGRDD